MCGKMATARDERLDKSGDDQHGAAGAGWTPPGRCVDEVATGIRLIWALFYVADEEPQMRHATRANGGDQEATRTRQMRIFYITDDEPQMRHETSADVPIKK
ncbi:uncharacterized protein LOC144037734 isoform X2 [Vanacampus margaritifer]